MKTRAVFRKWESSSKHDGGPNSLGENAERNLDELVWVTVRR